MTDNHEDSKGGGGSAVGEKSPGVGQRRALYLFFIFLFLAAGGAYIWYAMRGAAYELSGIGKNRLLTANSAVGAAGSSVEKGGNFFASEEDLSQPLGKDGKRLMLASSLPQAEPGARGVVFGSGADAEADAAGGGSSGAAAASGGGFAMPALRATSLQAKLQAKQQSALSGMKGGQVSNTSSSGGEGPTVVAASGAGLGKGGQNKDSGPSVLNSLKSAFKSSMHGMRVTSQDAARTWVANAFTPTPEAEHSLQYSDRMRAKLDRINPQSIPGFLREQDLSAYGAKSLHTSRVGSPDVQKDLTAKALRDDKQFQRDAASGGGPSNEQDTRGQIGNTDGAGGGGGGGSEGGSGGGSGGGGALSDAGGGSGSLQTTSGSAPASVPDIRVDQNGTTVNGLSAKDVTSVSKDGKYLEVDKGNGVAAVNKVDASGNIGDLMGYRVTSFGQDICYPANSAAGQAITAQLGGK